MRSLSTSAPWRPARRVTRLALLLVAIAAISAAGAQVASAKTVWLCKPGAHPDPCTPGLSTTVYSPTLVPLRQTHPKAVRNPKVDCFYVYPTISDQTTTLANLQIDPEERSIALYQAARYSQYCRVFAPMYRQVTLPALLSGAKETPAQLKVPLDDVVNAFKTYLRKYNHGREFVLLGHSQGSFVLEQLIAKLIDPKPALRKRMLSAILLGGNVLVKDGKQVGGTFKHIPACQSNTQLHCVVAYSSFDQTPPNPSLFGRSTVSGEHVLCTNPASLKGGAANIDPIFPSAPFAPGSLIGSGIAGLHLTQPTPGTVWSSEPNSYSAQCESVAGANVLMLTARHGAQVATPSPTPEWGLHLLDANIELGNLIAVVKDEAAAFAKHT